MRIQQLFPTLALLAGLTLVGTAAATSTGDDYAVSGWLQRARAAYPKAPENARSEHGADLAVLLGRTGQLGAALRIASGLPAADRLPALDALGRALLENSDFEGAIELSAGLADVPTDGAETADELLRMRYELLVRAGALSEAEALYAESSDQLARAGTDWITSRDRAIAHASSEAAHRSSSIARRVRADLEGAGCNPTDLSPIDTALMLRALREGRFDEGTRLLDELEQGRRLRDVAAAREAQSLIFAHELDSGVREAALQRAAAFAERYSDNSLLAELLRDTPPARAAGLVDATLASAVSRDSNGLDRAKLYAAAALAIAREEERSEALLQTVVAFDTDATLTLLEALCQADREERARELSAGVRDLEIAVDLESARIALDVGNLDRFERRMDAARARVQRDRLWPRLLLAEALVELGRRHEARMEIDRLYDALSVDPDPAPEHVRRLVALDIEKRGGFGLQLALERSATPALQLRLTVLAALALAEQPEG